MDSRVWKGISSLWLSSPICLADGIKLRTVETFLASTLTLLARVKLVRRTFFTARSDEKLLIIHFVGN